MLKITGYNSFSKKNFKIIAKDKNYLVLNLFGFGFIWERRYR